jgi:hypothetical protein
MNEDQAPAPTRVDVSGEAVERLASEYCKGEACEDVCRVLRSDCCYCARTGATLRALAAQRDELLAALEAMVEAVGNADLLLETGEGAVAYETGQQAITRARGGAA